MDKNKNGAFRFETEAEAQAFQQGVEALRRAILKLPEADQPLAIADLNFEIEVVATDNTPMYSVNELAQAEALAQDHGMQRALAGVHELFINEDADPIAGLEGDRPFCRFYAYSDRGDASVGIPSRGYWTLDKDQSGTDLEDLLKRAGTPVTSA